MIRGKFNRRKPDSLRAFSFGRHGNGTACGGFADQIVSEIPVVILIRPASVRPSSLQPIGGNPAQAQA
jgi:hypothetical protein